METIKLEIILSHASGPVLGCVAGTTEDVDAIIAEGYLKEDKGGVTSLTEKGTALVENLKSSADLFEKAYTFHAETVETFNKVKESTAEIFGKIRNNTGDFLHKMADTIKK